ncbi:hypothetical protein HWB57_gp128 [Erwinia phage vB_EamM-Bue1]|uniref:Uncharacterized protein n=1 Tax=Erwinia phage vB_EamM-Bue1 TaxID=2099338 RepID=A0A2P1JUD6_9CAUD|nr:hypothetical protein HWB57_gp128 [Erwinia phage vB_EamM-Bue1]AVO22965.1 hypothetical protein [Erwinia phage vB_EamM-Bue1]
MNISEFYIGQRNDNDRLEDLCRNLRNLRIQLSGEFPSTLKADDPHETISLLQALEYQQNRTGAILEEIHSHLDVIRSNVGEYYDPEQINKSRTPAN